MPLERCPHCQGNLIYDGQDREFVCLSCSRRFPTTAPLEPLPYIRGDGAQRARRRGGGQFRRRGPDQASWWK